MPKLFIMSLGTIFVLLSGLVSCSPEKKTRDEYHPAPPLIKGAGGSQALKAWDTQSRKELDLQDHIDFTPSAAAHIAITSRCRAGARELRDSFLFSGSPDLTVFKVLPEEVLVQDLVKTEWSCSFELNLFNEAGSNHIFNLPSAILSSAAKPDVAVAHEPARPQSPARLNFSVGDLQDVKIRYANTAASAVKFACTDMTLAPLSFDTVTEASRFNFSAPELRPERTAEALENTPLQLCRAIITSSGQRIGISALFELGLRDALHIDLTFARHRDGEIPQVAAEGLSAMQVGGAMTLNQWKLTNTSPFPRYFRFAKKNFSVNTKVVFNADATNHPLSSVSGSRPWVEFGPSSEAGAGSDTLEIPANSHATIQARFVPTGRMGCFPLAVFISAFEPFTFEEVNKAGAVIGRQEVSLGARVVFLALGQNADVLANANAPYGFCSWP
jgi:hypothetical protein